MSHLSIRREHFGQAGTGPVEETDHLRFQLESVKLSFQCRQLRHREFAVQTSRFVSMDQFYPSCLTFQSDRMWLQQLKHEIAGASDAEHFTRVSHEIRILELKAIQTANEFASQLTEACARAALVTRLELACKRDSHQSKCQTRRETPREPGHMLGIIDTSV